MDEESAVLTASGDVLPPLSCSLAPRPPGIDPMHSVDLPHKRRLVKLLEELRKLQLNSHGVVPIVSRVCCEDDIHIPSTPHYAKDTFMSRKDPIAIRTHYKYTQERIKYLRSLSPGKLHDWRCSIFSEIISRVMRNKVNPEEHFPNPLPNAQIWHVNYERAKRNRRALLLEKHSKFRSGYDAMRSRHQHATLKRLKLLSDEELRHVAFSLLIVLHRSILIFPALHKLGIIWHSHHDSFKLAEKYGRKWLEITRAKILHKRQRHAIHILGRCFRKFVTKLRVLRRNNAVDLAIKGMRDYVTATRFQRTIHKFRTKAIQIQQWWSSMLLCRSSRLELVVKQWMTYSTCVNIVGERTLKKRKRMVKQSPMWEQVISSKVMYLESTRYLRRGKVPNSELKMLLSLCAEWVCSALRQNAVAKIKYVRQIRSYISERKHRMMLANFCSDGTAVHLADVFNTSSDTMLISDFERSVDIGNEENIAMQLEISLPMKPAYRYFMRPLELQELTSRLGRVNWPLERRLQRR